MLLLSRPTAGVQGPGELWWEPSGSGSCCWAGWGSPPGSPRPSGGQQPWLVLGCVDLCLEEGGCVRESCLGVCEREENILVCLRVSLCVYV